MKHNEWYSNQPYNLVSKSKPGEMSGLVGKLLISSRIIAEPRILISPLRKQYVPEELQTYLTNVKQEHGQTLSKECNSFQRAINLSCLKSFKDMLIFIEIRVSSFIGVYVVLNMKLNEYKDRVECQKGNVLYCLQMNFFLENK